MRMRIAQPDQQGFSILAGGKALDVEPDGFAQRLIGWPVRRCDGCRQAAKGG